jgi:predicted  nucleic acid-binding Zn-ribbon protein
MEHYSSEQQTKIEQAESSLYSGRIQNPKELQDLQKDIGSLKKHLATIEDQELQAMMDLEDAEKQEATAVQAYRQAQAEAIQSKAGLAGEKEQLNKTRQRLEAERAVVLTPIHPQSLEIYNRIREQKKGVAVTALEDDSCALCGATIRPSEGQAARMQANLLYCSSCGRILYAG